jgi:phosphoribosylamine--glycine ligase
MSSGVDHVVLVVGSGAREHALKVALARSGARVVVSPGNAGTGEKTPLDVEDPEAVAAFAANLGASLVVVGPELPLTLGVVDALAARGILAFGPTKASARLEASKAFMKRFCARHGIATAPFETFDDPDAAEAYVRSAARPLVVKADGLCAGKGVVVAQTTAEALAAVHTMMRERAFGAAGDTVVIEELLSGEEASFHIVTDGVRAVALAPAQDHKRVGDGDRGPNTGGMGAYAPAPIVTPDVHACVMHDIVEPTLRGMAAEGAPFRGVLFVGLMIDGGTARVLEFNVRFGDPETSVILPLVEGDLYALFEGAARGDLSNARASTREGAALAVVMAAAGYPGKPKTGDPIAGLDAPLPEGAFVLHAGTSRVGDRVVTAGGRVLVVGAQARSLADAQRAAYAAAAPIRWDGEHHRSDIGARALARENLAGDRATGPETTSPKTTSPKTTSPKTTKG